MDRAEHVDIPMDISTVVKYMQAIFCDAYRFAVGNDFSGSLIINLLVIFPEFPHQRDVHLPTITIIVAIEQFCCDRLARYPPY